MAEKQIMSELNLSQQLPLNLEVEGTPITARRFSIEDAEFLYTLTQDSSVNEYLPWVNSIHSIERAEECIKSWQGTDSTARYVIESGNVPCGYFGVWADAEPEKCQTGSALLPEYRGKGIANIVFSAIEPKLKGMGIRAVVSYVDKNNLASQKMIERRGLTEVSQGRNKIRYEKDIPM